MADIETRAPIDPAQHPPVITAVDWCQAPAHYNAPHIGSRPELCLIVNGVVVCAPCLLGAFPELGAVTCAQCRAPIMRVCTDCADRGFV